MIDGYSIKKINGEDVLYLYCSFQYEFGSFSFSKMNFLTTVQKFLLKNHISFTGNVIAIVVGGYLLSTISLTEPIDNQPVISNSPSVSIDEKVDFPLEEKEEEEFMHYELETVSNSSEENPSFLDTSTYVSVFLSNGSFVSMELEDYVIGVVGAEMPASFSMEALKAQAVIARTYALKSISNGRILNTTNQTQKYKSNAELQELWGSSYSTYYSKVFDAVHSTEGKYLTYQGDYIEAVYHSTSNGKTENSIYVWGNSFPYLVSVDSFYDNSNPSFQKELIIPYEEVSQKLNTLINSTSSIQILGKTDGNRISSIKINDTVFSGVLFRNLLGLRSSDFDIEMLENGMFIRTRGYGHGVGLSQYGANGMAKNGSSYEEILLHYYPGVSLN